jgi:hypothetical protein
MKFSMELSPTRNPLTRVKRKASQKNWGALAADSGQLSFDFSGAVAVSVTPSFNPASRTEVANQEVMK